MANVDIITGKEVKKGYKVREDLIIRLIRWFKKKTGTYIGNNLYVAEESYDDYLKKRKRFENYVLFATIFAVFIFFVSVLIPLINGDLFRALSMFVAVLALIILIYLMVFTQYVPSIEEQLTVIEPETKETEAKETQEQTEAAIEKETKEQKEKKQKTAKSKGKRYKYKKGET
jgi:uncharacterized protein YacL